MNALRSLNAGRRALLVGGLLAALAGAPATASTTWYVNGGNPACSNSGPGDAAVPFCTIQKGASRATSGDTVLVSPGLYREQVTLKNSGLPGLPVLFKAAGPGVKVLGSADLSRADKWKRTTNRAWRRSIDFIPKQVFVDGARLDASPQADPMATNTFFFDAPAQMLYVSIGGPNPGLGHAVEASKGTYGFNILNLSDITLEGFEVMYQNSSCVRIVGSSNITLKKMNISYAGTYGVRIESSPGGAMLTDCTIGESVSNGIVAVNSSGVTVKNSRSYHNGFNGISLQSTTGSLVLGNAAYANFRWNVSSATGIDISQGSTGNTVQGNTTYSNQDSGVQVYSGSNGNIVARNVSYNNGDHGFDTNHSTGTLYVSNTSTGNFKDGFSIEGGSTNTTLNNNIAVDNGLTTREFDVYVDDLSASGFKSDYNILWNSAPGIAVKVNGHTYATLTAFRATGNEAHGIDADPQFVDGTQAMDLRLAESSPAIDSADSGAVGFAMKDCEGFMPADAPGAPNIGQGPSAFADRGAFEWDPPPTPSLYLTPANGEINLTITADASGSIDPDDRPIDTYTFDFGDGTVMGPMTHSACPHTYTMPGTYPVLVTVTDTAGKKSIAGSTVTALDHPPGARVAVTPSFGMVDLPVVADASASRGTELTPIASYMFDFGDGSVIGPQPDPICNHTFTSAGEYTVLVTVTNASGASTTASQTVTVMDEAPTATLNVTPKLGIIGLIVTADASGSSDADSTRIVSYMFEFGDGTVVGPQSSPLTSHTYVADGEFTVRVSVSDSAGNVGQTSTSVRVVSNSAPQAALSVAFAVGRKPFGVVADASRSTDTDPAPIASYTFDFGDGTIVGPQSSPTALHIYRKKGYHTISVTVTDTAGLSSRASAAILVKKKHRK